MAEEVSIDILINTAESATKIGDIKKSLRDLKSAAIEAGEGTAEFTRLTTAAGKLQDKVNDTNDTIRVLAGNTTEQLTRAFSSVAQAGIGAFQAVAGAQAIFGSENEDLQKQMVKLQGLLNLSQGIAQFGNIGQAAKDFKTVLVALVPSLFTATAAQEGLNVAMSLNPAGILVTAILALGAAYVLFSDDTDEAAEAQKKLNAEQEAYNKLLDEEADNLRERKSIVGNDIEREIELARAKGATLSQIRDLEIKLTNARLNELKSIEAFRGQLNSKELEEQKDLKNQLLIIEAKYLNDVKALREKEAKELEERKVKDLENLKVRLAEENTIIDENAFQRRTIETERRSSFEQAQLDAAKEFNISKEQLMNEFYSQDIEDFETYLQYKRELEKKYGAQGVSIAADKTSKIIGYEMVAADTINNLNNLVTAIEIRNLKEGEKVSLEVQKKQFKRKKALAIVDAVINTQLAMISMLKDPGGIEGFVLAGVARLNGMLAVATILAQKFQPEGGTSGSVPQSTIPSIGTSFNNNGGGFSSPSSFSPSPSLVNPITPTFTGTAGAFGGNAVQAYVLESELTDAQLRAELIRRRARMR